MYISDILKLFNPKYEYEIKNEKEFEVLGLTVSDAGLRTCTFLDDEKYVDYIKGNVTMIVTNQKNAKKLMEKGYGVCICDKPRKTFFELHNFLSSDDSYIRKRTLSIIGEGTLIDKNASVSQYNVVIGNNVIIEERVSIKENVVIGDNTIIRAGSIIGGEGFEFKRDGDTIFGVKHVGGVVIGQNVEIQYNTTIDKAVYPWDNTEIGDYTKIDNLVHVGHAAKIGDRVMIVAHAGIGGRTCIGDDVWIGFGAIVRNGLEIENNARVNMGAIVTKNVQENEAVSGNFAIEHGQFINNLKKMNI